MISKRTLTKWRREALKTRLDTNYGEWTDEPYKALQDCTERIICMTQELLDQHLLKELKG